LTFGRIIGPQRGLTLHQLRYRYTRFTQRLIYRGRVAFVCALESHRHHRTGIKIHRVFGLVGKVVHRKSS
jgi:hypothetical protein